jgi:CheY-like chemotaxis protein
LEDLAVLPHPRSREHEPRIRLLLADDDTRMRSLLAACARDTVEAIVVLEATDGAEAIQLGLRQRPQIALLDFDLPLLGGIEAAIALRELEPRMRVALQTADLRADRDDARAHRLPLFDKLELHRALSWLEVQAQSCTADRPKPRPPQRRSLECSSCGYGICCSRAPERCPMCHAQDGWIHAPWRPFRIARGVGEVTKLRRR